MAFTCFQCWKKEHPEAVKQIKKGETVRWHWAAKSYGPCETCGKTAECLND